MTELYQYIIENTNQFLGVLFSIIYVILSIRENIFCWHALIIASIFNAFAFYQIQLTLQIIMQFFFIFTGIYGWHNWKNGDSLSTLKISSWSTKIHLQYIMAGVIITLILWLLLLALKIKNTSPFLDALMFTFNIIPMYMMGKKILESWIYFIAIDIISGFFYLSTGEYFYCFLFFCYLGFATKGYMTWKNKKI
jgi:nicotinamide mononucleotide transporter